MVVVVRAHHLQFQREYWLLGRGLLHLVGIWLVTGGDRASAWNISRLYLLVFARLLLIVFYSKVVGCTDTVSYIVGTWQDTKIFKKSSRSQQILTLFG